MFYAFLVTDIRSKSIPLCLVLLNIVYVYKGEQYLLDGFIMKMNCIYPLISHRNEQLKYNCNNLNIHHIKRSMKCLV